MRSGILIACLIGFGLLSSGCASSDRNASMGVIATAEEPLVLGAGDALGVQIYVHDLVIAARADEAQRLVSQWSEASAHEEIGLESVVFHAR